MMCAFRTGIMKSGLRSYVGGSRACLYSISVRVLSSNQSKGLEELNAEMEYLLGGFDPSADCSSTIVSSSTDCSSNRSTIVSSSELSLKKEKHFTPLDGGHVDEAKVHGSSSILFVYNPTDISASGLSLVLSRGVVPLTTCSLDFDQQLVEATAYSNPAAVVVYSNNSEGLRNVLEPSAFRRSLFALISRAHPVILVQESTGQPKHVLDARVIAGFSIDRAMDLIALELSIENSSDQNA